MYTILNPAFVKKYFVTPIKIEFFRPLKNKKTLQVTVKLNSTGVGVVASFTLVTGYTHFIHTDWIRLSHYSRNCLLFSIAIQFKFHTQCSLSTSWIETFAHFGLVTNPGRAIPSIYYVSNFCLPMYFLSNCKTLFTLNMSVLSTYTYTKEWVRERAQFIENWIIKTEWYLINHPGGQ